MKRFKDIGMRTLLLIALCVVMTTPAFAAETIKGDKVILDGPLVSQRYLDQVKNGVSISSWRHTCSEGGSMTCYNGSYRYKTIYAFNVIKLSSGTSMMYDFNDISRAGTINSRSYTTTYYPNATLHSGTKRCRSCRRNFNDYSGDNGTEQTGTFSQQYLNITKTFEEVVLRNCTTQDLTLRASKAVTINGGNYQGSPAVNSGNITVLKGTLTDNSGNSTFIIGPDSEATSTTSGTKTVTTVKLSNPPIIIDWADFPGIDLNFYYSNLLAKCALV